MADKPYMGFKGGYNSRDANSMLSELYPAIAKTAKMGISNMWNGMDTTSKAATVAGLVPFYGDIAGVANDARLYAENPEMRTPVNYGLSALGMLPLMPSMGVVKGVVKGVGKNIVPPVDVVKSIKPKPIKAPASDVGFYSPVEKAALNLNRNQGSGQSFLNDLKKGENVKGDELIYTELEDWLKTKPNLTKQEVQDYIANNKLDVKEVVLGGKKSQYPHTTADEWQDAISQAERTRNFDEAERLTLAWEDFEGLGQNTKYAKYQLPNGDFYTEILLTLPKKLKEIPEGFKLDTYVDNGQKKYGIYKINGYGDRYGGGATKQEALDEFSKFHGENNYKPSHWEIPNVLAHIRINHRIDANGKKTTLIEEVQSDWHQAGRDKGYRNDGVPDAPFKDDWYKLALKRAIKEAVDNGSDSISLTTGKRQIERYPDQLRQNVDKIEFFSGYPNEKQTSINAVKNGQIVFEGNAVNGIFIDGAAEGKTIDEVFEKSITQKIKSYDHNSQGLGIIKGDDLSIGGEGMKKYYDEIYPAFLNKFGKKYGVKVEDNIIDIGTPDEKFNFSHYDPVVKSEIERVLKYAEPGTNATDDLHYFMDEIIKNADPEDEREIINQALQVKNNLRVEDNTLLIKSTNPSKNEKVYTLRITPQMREDVLKGQPLTSNEQDKNQYYA